MVTVRHRCQSQTTSWGQPSAEATLCFYSGADSLKGPVCLMSVFNVSDVHFLLQDPGLPLH